MSKGISFRTLLHMKRKINIFLLLLSSTFFLFACSGSNNENYTLGIKHYNNGEYTEAVSAFESAVLLDKTNANNYIHLAMSYIELGQYEKALEQFQLAIELEPENQKIHRGMGIAYLAIEEYEKSIFSFGAALSYANGKVSNLEFDILDYRAIAEVKSKMYTQAIDTYSILIDIDYNTIQQYYLRGNVYLLQNDLASAENDFEKALELSPSNYKLYLDIYHGLDESFPDEAKKYLEKALLVESPKKDDSLNLGKIYFYLEDYDNSITTLTRAKEKGNPESILFLGRIYNQVGNDTQALLTFMEYLDSKPYDGTVYNEIGLIKLEKSEYTEALTYFQDGIKCNDLSSLKELRFNEAITYEYLGDFDTAFTKFSDYISIYPDDAMALREYDFLRTR